MVRADLLADAAGLLQPDWLTGRRWYGANDRHLATIHLSDAAPLPLGGRPAEGWLLVVEARFSDTRTNRYLVPALRDAGSFREPRPEDRAWAAIAAAMTNGDVLDGDGGSFRGHRQDAARDLLPADGGVERLPERPLGVEQSNTSVAIGDGLLLKLYRRLEAGPNPELEMSSFLESVACPVVPRLAASLLYVGQAGSAAAAILQERIEASGDAWSRILELLGGTGGDPEEAVGEAGRIGETTAMLHASLAARPRDMAFPVRAAGAGERDALRDAAQGQLDAAMAALAHPERDRLRRCEGRIRRRITAGFASAEPLQVMRVHGDYHLGQLLAVSGGYLVIDFEGEPARAIAERRAPQPPERDLAGMLRSFDYAARTAERTRPAPGFSPEAWLAAARSAFLRSYSASAPAPPNLELLAGLELEKACYEVRYEAAHRPGWVWLPLEALERA